MTTESRVEAVRGGYESFNQQDLAGVLAILADDVEWPDIVNASVLQGKEAVGAYLGRMFALAPMRITLGEVIPLGDDVIATTYQEFYEPSGKPIGQARLVVNRFTFRGDLASRMVVTSSEDIPDEVRRRYLDESS